MMSRTRQHSRVDRVQGSRIVVNVHEVTRDFWSSLMFPKLVEQGGLDDDEAFYDGGDYSQAA